MTDPPLIAANVILPAGTRVVTRTPVAANGESHPAGAVGTIIRAPLDHDHAYRIALVDGRELTLRRVQFSILRELQREDLQQSDAAQSARLLHECIIYRCVIGSRAYGLDHEQSDTDRRGVFLPPADMHWSLYGVPEQIELDTAQECYWELQKFLTLGLKANPNILECLYTPLVEFVTPLGRELLEMRRSFLSKLIYQTYNGYVISQFKKLEQDLRTRGEVRWKHAMHLIRLLRAGIAALQFGEIAVRVDADRDELLAIRRGELPWPDVERLRLDLHRAFDAAFEQTQLPDRPDYDRVNAFLIKARRAAAGDRPHAGI